MALEGWYMKMGYGSETKSDRSIFNKSTCNTVIPTTEEESMSNEVFVVRAIVAGLTAAANAMHQFLSTEAKVSTAALSVVEGELMPPEANAAAPGPTTEAPKRGRGRPAKVETQPPAPEPEVIDEDPFGASEPEADPLAEEPKAAPEPKPVTKQDVTTKLLALRDADQAAGKPARERVDLIIKKVVPPGTKLTIDAIPVEKYALVCAAVDKCMASK